MPKTKTLSPVDMLKEDHQKVKKLFSQFQKAKTSEAKQPLLEEIDRELRIHAKLEEEIFYPAMAQVPELHEMLAESKEEHHVVETLLNELQNLAPQDEAYEAKFTVMMENVQHHAEEEEKEMFPKASKVDGLDALAERMQKRKQELMSEIAGSDGSRVSKPSSRGRNSRTAAGSSLRQA